MNNNPAHDHGNQHIAKKLFFGEVDYRRAAEPFQDRDRTPRESAQIPGLKPHWDKDYSPIALFDQDQIIQNQVSKQPPRHPVQSIPPSDHN